MMRILDATVGDEIFLQDKLGDQDHMSSANNLLLKIVQTQILISEILGLVGKLSQKLASAPMPIF